MGWRRCATYFVLSAGRRPIIGCFFHGCLPSRWQPYQQRSGSTIVWSSND
ncbi:hypothetical protein IF1G_02569 [Cordyceps javanica]|uniref:Uncharacterized protein n=1 Tax=Cordyceps javanica TaxID=43265 RepID=A0A545VA58_9HYPO|nr:hypothetical protein IF1G_02569 [Cordyceps javanica]